MGDAGTLLHVDRAGQGSEGHEGGREDGGVKHDCFGESEGSSQV